LNVVRCIRTNAVYASMGNFSFAAMGLRLQAIDVGGILHFCFPRSGAFEFLFVTEPMDWETIPYAACRLPKHGIVMQQSAAAMPLMQHSLREQSNSLTVDDIEKCVKHLKIETTPPSNTLPDMFSALATKFCGDDVEAVRKEVNLFERARLPRRDDDEQLLDDPLLEVVYDDMDPEDKSEFKEIGDAKQKRKYAAKVDIWKAACAREQKRQQNRRVGKAKGKGKGKGEGKGKGKGKGKVKGKAKGKAAKAKAAPAPPPVLAALPAPEPEPPPAPIPLPAPAAAFVAAEPLPADPGAPHPRGPNYGVSEPWRDIQCDHCARVTGQKKMSLAPGGRDEVIWFWRCFDVDTGMWPLSGSLKKTKLARLFDGDPAQDINDWVQTHRTCCPQ
jgi:hypothetical protein